VETPKESDEGYAEEQPAEVAGDGENAQRKERDGEGADEATESGDGTATGNPRSAG
jgi:hypothetical protein